MLILQHLPLRSYLSLGLPLLLSHIKVKDTMSNILLVMRVLTKANSLPRSCSCVWCVCAQVYTNIICKSRGPGRRERGRSNSLGFFVLLPRCWDGDKAWDGETMSSAAGNGWHDTNYFIMLNAQPSQGWPFSSQSVTSQSPPACTLPCQQEL